jgi:magnesium chelatase family protein
MAPPESILRVDTLRNLIVMTGTRPQIEGWMDIINTFDVDLLKGMSVGVFPLKHVSTQDVEKAIRLISGGNVVTPSRTTGAAAAAPVSGNAPSAAPSAAAISSDVGLLGGSTNPTPGEVSLAHHGVLFLDELTEFRREVLDQLRQPLEAREVWISRARDRCRFPCAITLVAATNPCPCGWWGDRERECRCPEGVRRRYWGRLSGPLLDRMDLQVVMQRAQPRELVSALDVRVEEGPRGELGVDRPETTAQVASRVKTARARMVSRNPGGCSNSDLPAAALKEVLGLDQACVNLWEAIITQRRLSARSSDRILRVSRTLADLKGVRTVGSGEISEALGYRSFDLTTREEG